MKTEILNMLAAGKDFDLIDAHNFYPDGVAAVLLGKWFNKPVVITARSTNISLTPHHALPRKMILWAAKHAAGMIAVCQALKDEMDSLGIPDSNIVALRNGVDLELFQPCDRQAERSRLKLLQIIQIILQPVFMRRNLAGAILPLARFHYLKKYFCELYNDIQFVQFYDYACCSKITCASQEIELHA